MKHLVLILSFFVSFFSYAQKYSLGIKVGGSGTWPSFGDKDDKEQFKRGVALGYSVGGVVSFPLKHEFDLFVEGGYAKRGRRMSFDDGDRLINQSVYNMVDGTLLLRKSFTFKLEKNVKSQWFINLGPDISYLMSGHGALIYSGIHYDYNIVFNQSVENADTKTMFYNNVNRWLFGLSFGAGIKAPLLHGQHITTEFRYVSGHTFLGNRDSSFLNVLQFQGNDTLKTNLKSFLLNISYTFDFDVQQSRKGKSTLKKQIKKRR